MSMPIGFFVPVFILCKFTPECTFMLSLLSGITFSGTHVDRGMHTGVFLHRGCISKLSLHKDRSKTCWPQPTTLQFRVGSAGWFFCPLWTPSQVSRESGPMTLGGLSLLSGASAGITELAGLWFCSLTSSRVAYRVTNQGSERASGDAHGCPGPGGTRHSITSTASYRPKPVVGQPSSRVRKWTPSLGGRSR